MNKFRQSILQSAIAFITFASTDAFPGAHSAYSVEKEKSSEGDYIYIYVCMHACVYMVAFVLSDRNTAQNSEER
jgi:hypothetical protein